MRAQQSVQEIETQKQIVGASLPPCRPPFPPFPIMIIIIDQPSGSEGFPGCARPLLRAGRAEWVTPLGQRPTDPQGAVAHLPMPTCSRFSIHRAGSLGGFGRVQAARWMNEHRAALEAIAAEQKRAKQIEVSSPPPPPFPDVARHAGNTCTAGVTGREGPHTCNAVQTEQPGATNEKITFA